MKFVHANLIANDWRRLAQFYRDVFECVPAPPERDYSGDWLDRATGLNDSHLTGVHLRLPGYGDDGPTLELFGYDSMPNKPAIRPNTPGFSHIAFAVDDVKSKADEVLAHSGKVVGELTEITVPDAGRLIFQYMADPEGNIVELQRWYVNV
jgi:predicted enzyme related to lactoylglutathione lyase